MLIHNQPPLTNKQSSNPIGIQVEQQHKSTHWTKSTKQAKQEQVMQQIFQTTSTPISKQPKPTSKQTQTTKSKHTQSNKHKSKRSKTKGNKRNKTKNNKTQNNTNAQRNQAKNTTSMQPTSS